MLIKYEEMCVFLNSHMFEIRKHLDKHLTSMLSYKQAFT